jgi:hypothetical protein
MTDPTRHNYYRKLLDLLEQGKITAGRLNHVEFLHDNWCGINKGGYCNCEVEVNLRPGWDIDPEGQLVEGQA